MATITPRHGDDPYEPTPMVGTPTLPQSVRYCCPVCGFSIRPDERDALLEDFCPICFRRILTLLKVPRLRPIPVAHPAETAREQRQPLRPRPAEDLVVTKPIVRRRPEIKEIDETLAREVGKITLPTRNLPRTPGPFSEDPP